MVGAVARLPGSIRAASVLAEVGILTSIRRPSAPVSDVRPDVPFDTT